MADLRTCPDCGGDGCFFIRNHTSIHYATSDSALYDVVHCEACDGSGKVAEDAGDDPTDVLHGQTLRPS